MKVLKSISLIILFSVFLVSLADRAQSVELAATQSRFDELMQVIQTGNAYQRAETIPSLAHTGDTRVVPILIDLLKDEDNRVRVYAAQQLDRLADKRSTEALADALSDPYYNVRMYAARGLAKIGTEKHVPALVAAIINKLPDWNDPEFRSWSLRVVLETIGKLSSKAPPEIVTLLGRISEDKEIGDSWWLFYEAVAQCLGQIGDKTAYDELQRVDKVLSAGHQDYKTWYAVRKALAATNPEEKGFDRPAADILNSIREFKITREGIQQRWVQPLADLNNDAIEDLNWVLMFDDEQDQERKRVALEALGEIGGPAAAKVLREYIRPLSVKFRDDNSMNMMRGGVPGAARTNRKLLRRHRYPLRKAMLALLKADPTKKTVEEAVGMLPILFRQDVFMYEVGKATPAKIPTEVTISLCEKILTAAPKDRGEGLNAFRGRGLNVYAAAKLLSRIGGEEAGEAFSLVLLESDNPKARNEAARALGTVEDYDAILTLLEAYQRKKASIAMIAYALGEIKDQRANPLLKEMASLQDLSQLSRLWVAAALARSGIDYEQNALVVRKALPNSFDQAKWLYDTETVNAVAGYLEADGYTGQQALAALEAIGTAGAFRALVSFIDLDKTMEPGRLQKLSEAAARMAKKLEHDSENYYADMATVSKAVPGWFEIHQRARPQPEVRASYETVKRHAALARKLWIMEATRRLDLAAKQQDRENWKFNIPEQAIRAAEEIFAPELVPVLERIARESRDKVSFHGKYKMVEFYNVRSLAAKILTEKTGQVHTFLDADGRSHPGGWNPSQEK